MRWGLAAALVGAGVELLSASPAVAAPPVLVSAYDVNRHPAASWTLPPGVKSQVAEVATSPATSTDGYFFSENVKAFDVLEPTQTSWVYNFQLDPGIYYVHIAGLDEPCFYAGLCPVREFTQTAALVIEAPPPPPPPPPPRPRYEASVRSVHPGAVALPGNWTYLGDTLRVRFRNATARASDGRGYRVCYTYRRRLACRWRRILARGWDSWRLRVTPAMVAPGAGRVGPYVEFTWRVNQQVVARKRVKVFYD
jgi:hypothetical protein